MVVSRLVSKMYYLVHLCVWILNTQKFPNLSVLSFFSLTDQVATDQVPSGLWMWDVRWRQRTKVVSDRERVKLS